MSICNRKSLGRCSRRFVSLVKSSLCFLLKPHVVTMLSEVHYCGVMIIFIDGIPKMVLILYFCIICYPAGFYLMGKIYCYRNTINDKWLLNGITHRTRKIDGIMTCLDIDVYVMRITFAITTPPAEECGKSWFVQSGVLIRVAFRIMGFSNSTTFIATSWLAVFKFC